MPETFLGIDTGSVAISMVQLDHDGSVINSGYRFHKGRITETLLEMETGFDLSSVRAVAHVSGNRIFSKKVPYHDSLTSIIEAAQHFYELPGALLYIGAARFHLINFDREGNYMNTVTNTSCAAGTGSFLDQQSGRLKLMGIEQLCEIANRNREEIPGIASRCAVFAKTDLIHAQQAGYSLEAICDSLCQGLARNIADTLFSDASIREPIVFAGGVSLNPVVRRHLEDLLQTTFEVHPHSNFFGAIGAALQAIRDKVNSSPAGLGSLSDIIECDLKKKEYFHSPLQLSLSYYPDFNSGDSEIFTSVYVSHHSDVQVDIYEPVEPGKSISGYLGTDIGSTSTKAMLMSQSKQPIAGFYTYTNGQPVKAMQAIFEAIDNFLSRRTINFQVLGMGTTGSGRKFIGKITGADIILDEITSHARAAYELNPETDTIIEIGGQDSKFTLMRDGNVIFSEMNSVCAAGTGSFIEELSAKLSVSLEEYSGRSENSPAPLSSDRCTVFMERDINNYLSSGFSVDECLASILHSVRENYLRKVATEGAIGENVCFQGATAKNKALVAAFEARLEKEIFVSRYCHLTGAFGVALHLADEKVMNSTFRGFGLYSEEIPVETEICTLCNNRCKIRLTTLSGEKIAYGFLCGRDYDTRAYVERNSSGFDLIKERRKLFAEIPGQGKGDSPIIGIPAALHLIEEVTLWRSFFHRLGFRTVTSEGIKNAVRKGKRLAGAEFCAPVDAMYGHVEWLADRCDHIFLPVYLESNEKDDNKDRLYCYYTQYISSVASLMREKEIYRKSIVPLLNNGKSHDSQAKELHKYLRRISPEPLSLALVNAAWQESMSEYRTKKLRLKEAFARETDGSPDISIVLLGRPYLILDPSMNKGIPDIFQGMGYKTFYQDMVPISAGGVEEIDYLLRVFPWYFAVRILEAAGATAGIKNVYPVFITAFKCAPDSFVIEYFKKILEKHHKPYLILQTDDHDSSVGYETRIEAAIRSFKNHSALDQPPIPLQTAIITPPLKSLDNSKTLLFPNWDPLTSPLLVANLQRAGINAKLLESSDLTIRKSMAHNTGQCLPLNIITQDYIDYIEKYDLDPGKTMLWITETRLSCNIRLYPYYIKTILDSYGKGFENSAIYSGELSHLEISVNTTYHAYFAYMFGGMLRRLGCNVRPYEVEKGRTDSVTEKSLQILIRAFKGNYALEKAGVEINELFDAIEIVPGNRPKVAIFGDFYVRDNDVMNQGLITTIEDAGGEVINTPYNDYTKLAAENAIRRRIARGHNLEALGFRAFLSGLMMLEKRYYKPFEKRLGKIHEFSVRKIEKNLSKFNIKPFHSGESYDNLLKIFYLLEKYPDVSLFVQTNPGFCCPSLITEAIKSDIQRITKVPIVTITYDGTSESKNGLVIPYIKLLKRKEPVPEELTPYQGN
ncbi:MAG TPA: acyl-CoA dehydratase activase [Bacteroidales bacterium]|nr:acyl-CoA dehydratase activase [Bacteroidales bacterium]